MTSYVRPSSIGDALAHLAKGGRSVLAGGTDAAGVPKALQSVQGWVAERL